MQQANRVGPGQHEGPPELTVTDLAASYGAKPIFSNINFTLKPGCLHLKGRNGAGKSTLINILAGTVASASGDIVLNQITLGQSPLAYKRLSSLVPDEPVFYPYVSVREYLHFVLSARQQRWDSQLDELLSDFGLTSQIDSQLGALSLGSKKKLFLAAGMHSATALLLLDEPSNGLELRARHTLTEWCRAQAQEKIIIFASHDTSFTASLATASFDIEHPQLA
ncbi:MAG: ABC transporter ATP-binding protein [Natronospirillum sp.]